jgi:hypothetical protein
MQPISHHSSKQLLKRLQSFVVMLLRSSE